ncbi:hypothetical protein [Rhizorhapis sp.]|uniref:hypothetical protein n=1 Tax=Rhizorhapis sp. TaxID=1968842 RepID=UPI002B470B5D|nr:hypothetical protein [Rhizorhapis sp.]HKR16918.1 hypothetical protein [Rhizorhapis sp.]
MNASFSVPRHRAATDPFASFYHRRTPRWHYHRPMLLAFAAATVSGGTILLSALALLT